MLAFANEEETGMATIFSTALEQVGKLNDKLDAASAKNAGQIRSSEAVNLQQVSENVLLSAAKVTNVNGNWCTERRSGFTNVIICNHSHCLDRSRQCPHRCLPACLRRGPRHSRHPRPRHIMSFLLCDKFALQVGNAMSEKSWLSEAQAVDRDLVLRSSTRPRRSPR